MRGMLRIHSGFFSRFKFILSSLYENLYFLILFTHEGMSLLYKEDWSETKEAFKAWWEGESNIIQIFTSKNGPYTPFPKFRVLELLAYPEIVSKEFEEWCKNTLFYLYAYPSLYPTFGPGIMATFFGSLPVYQSGTVWFTPVEGWENIPQEFDESHPIWIVLKWLTRSLARMGAGKYMVEVSDIGGILDIAASLRGVKTLLKDMYAEDPHLNNLLQLLTDTWFKVYDELVSILLANGMDGVSRWVIWCPRKWYPIQCDIAYLLSPTLFEKYALPHLKEQCLRIEYPIYHLDGVGQLAHIDKILNLDNLRGVQWVPGEGEEPHLSDKWSDLYEKILEKGKLLLLMDVEPDTVIPLLEKYGKKGLLITSSMERSKAEKIISEMRKKGYIESA